MIKLYMKSNSISMINLFSSQFKIIKTCKIRVLFYAVFFIFSCNLFAQEDSVAYSDTLSFMKCKVIVDYKQEIDHYIGTRSGITESMTISFNDCPKEKNIFGTITINTESTSFDDLQSALDDITIHPHNKHLYLFFDDSIRPLLDFAVRNDSLVFTTKFVKKLEQYFDFPDEHSITRKVNEVKRWDDIKQSFDDLGDTVTEFDDLYYILSNMSFTDMHPLRVLELVKSRKLMEAGEWDLAEANIAWLAQEASDNSDTYVTTRCEKLANEIAQYKNANIPFVLTDVHKIGTLSDNPIYPPGDNPTVFWQDNFLCVITDTSGISGKMHRYNPVQKQWGKVLPAKYPDCSMEGYYVVYPCYYCDDSTHYWNTAIALPGEDGSCDLCDCFTDPRPLISIPSDSIFIFKGGRFDSLAIERSGGSCIAGNGRYFFDNDSKLCLYNSKISWNILPEGIVSSGNSIDIDYFYSSYPVVVSPDQKWVAYAIKQKNGEKIELWVAKLNYQNK